MSSIRDLLAQLWAAVWVRIQLIRGRLPGHRRPSGPDYHFAEHEMPRAGIDYEPVEIPAYVVERLEIASADLVERRRVRRRRLRARRRGRAVVVAASALLGLAVMGAGASALIGNSTGVPEVDRLLGIQEERTPTIEQEADRLGIDPDAARRGVPPRPSAATTVTVDAPGDSGRVSSSFYVGRDGRICSAVAAAAGPDSIACTEVAGVLARTSKDHAFIAQLSLETGKVVARGFAAADVESVTLDGPSGSLEAELGKPWDIGDGRLVRPFLIIASADGAGSRQPDDVTKLVDPRSYAIVVDLVGGSTVQVAP